KGRDGCRTPMVWDSSAPHAGFTDAQKPWLPVPAGHAAKSVSAQDHTAGSVLAHYRETLRWRKAHPALRAGSMTFVETNQDLLAFIREGEGESLFFVFNLNRDAAEFTPPADLHIAEQISVPSFAASMDEGRIM